MENILKQIVEHKKEHISTQKRNRNLQEIKNNAQNHNFQKREFTHAIQASVAKRETTIIAEIKKGSPSSGIITDNFNVADIAQQYELGLATTISVLTDEHFFYGSNRNLQIARDNCKLPILRKDFIIDEYQIHESKLINADAILLIMSILEPSQAQELEHCARENGLDILLEVHDFYELESALNANINTPLIGVNNRNLKDFSINHNNSKEMQKIIPSDRILIAESGITSRQEIINLQSTGCYAFLVGTHLMKQKNIQSTLMELRGHVI